MEATPIQKKKALKYGFSLGAIGFWLVFWEILCRRINQDIFLPSPLAVIEEMFRLCQSLEFWRTIATSSFRIILGFLLALVMGILLAVGAYKSRPVSELITPVMKVIKTMPVASFIILALLWVKERNLSVLIAFLMVLPMIYSNVLQGLRAADPKLLEMAKVFRLSRRKVVTAIYIPSVMPYFTAAVSVGIGFSWKAGIAAEVIGTPANSIGKNLYEAKLYLMTKELFAWSVVIILISVIFEKILIRFFRLIQVNNAVRNQSNDN